MRGVFTGEPEVERQIVREHLCAAPYRDGAQQQLDDIHGLT